MSKKNEVAKSGSNVPAEALGLGAWGDQEISQRDIVVPKILCMQGLSELVTDEKAKMGDLVDSLTQEVIGNCLSKPVEFIPFHVDKVWIVSRSNGQDYEFHTIDQVTAANENREYEEMIDGIKYKNDFCYNFYVLRPEDPSLPYIISFKGTSRRAGSILYTQMYVRNKAAGKNPPAFVMELAGTKDKNDKGTYYKLSTKVKRESTNEEVGMAFNWYKTVGQGGVKAHDESKKKESNNNIINKAKETFTGAEEPVPF